MISTRKIKLEFSSINGAKLMLGMGIYASCFWQFRDSRSDITCVGRTRIRRVGRRTLR